NYKDALPLQAELVAIAERSSTADEDKVHLLDALSKFAYIHSKLALSRESRDDIRRFQTIAAQMHPAAEGYDCTRIVDPIFASLKDLGLEQADYDRLCNLIKAQSTATTSDGNVLPVPTPVVHDALSRLYWLSGRTPEAIAEQKKAVDELEK